MNTRQRDHVRAKLEELLHRLNTAEDVAEQEGIKFAETQRYPSPHYTKADATRDYAVGTYKAIVKGITAELRALNINYIAPRNRRFA